MSALEILTVYYLAQCCPPPYRRDTSLYLWPATIFVTKYWTYSKILAGIKALKNGCCTDFSSQQRVSFADNTKYKWY